MRLSLESSALLPPQVRRPPFDPRALAYGIVHLGCGAFHRAHQAVYTQEVLAKTFGPWGIIGVSLQNAGVRDRLVPQDCLYTVVERGPDGDHLMVVGSIRDVLVAPENPGAVVALIAAPETKVVSLTVTEKGYCHDPGTGRLNAAHPEIVHDLNAANRPRSTLGVLVGGLEHRMAQGNPLTVLCCDNLPRNGATLAGLVDAFARLRTDRLAAWIAANVTFPSTMIDRIVPATTADDIAAVERATGLHDAAPVVAEPFKQWVIEDRFAAGRPAWEIAGAELVPDVAPYEEMKLRLLNGSHSALAYLGYLAGYSFVADVMTEPSFVRFVQALMDEAAPTLHLPPGVDVSAYNAALIDRFVNPALKHRTWQIAMDGSQKLPQRLLGTVRDNLAAGRTVRLAALAVAAWMRYVTGIDEQGRPIDVKDPLAPRLKRIADDMRGDPAALARAIFGVREVFGDDLPRQPVFVGAVANSLGQLYVHGARKTIALTTGLG